MTVSMKKIKKNIPRKKVIEMAIMGHTTMEIASKIGCSQSAVSKILQKEGVKPARGKGQRGAGKNAFQKLIPLAHAILCNPGATPAEIAADTGVPEATIYWHLRELYDVLSNLWIAKRTEKNMDHEDVSVIFDNEVGFENAKIITAAALGRWETCTRGAQGIVFSVLSGKYYLSAMYIMQQLRRFMTADEKYEAALSVVCPGRIIHSVPGLARMNIPHDSRTAERAARAQARQHRADKAISPSTEILYAYHLLVSVSKKRSDQRDSQIIEMLKKIRFYEISADLTVEKAVFYDFGNYVKKLPPDTHMWMEKKIKDERDHAMWKAKIGAFIAGKKALRRLVRKYVLSYLGWAWVIAGSPCLPGGVDPEIAWQKMEEEIAAARDFFSNVDDLV